MGYFADKVLSDMVKDLRQRIESLENMQIQIQFRNVNERMDNIEDELSRITEK